MKAASVTGLLHFTMSTGRYTCTNVATAGQIREIRRYRKISLGCSSGYIVHYVSRDLKQRASAADTEESNG